MAEVPRRGSPLRLRLVACGRGSLERGGSWKPHSFYLLALTETGFSPQNVDAPVALLRGFISHCISWPRVGPITPCLRASGFQVPSPREKGLTSQLRSS